MRLVSLEIKSCRLNDTTQMSIYNAQKYIHTFKAPMELYSLQNVFSLKIIHFWNCHNFIDEKKGTYKNL